VRNCDNAHREMRQAREQDDMSDKYNPHLNEASALGQDGERIAKALARAGVASRREVERLIEAGRVTLNGVVLTTPAVKVGPGDILTVDGEVVGGAEPTRVFRYHKPAGLVTTHSDPRGRPTVFDAMPEGLPRVISVGRLDLNSEGLLLLTNDGALSRALELPSSGWIRCYRVRAFGDTSQEHLDQLKSGITVEGVRYGPIEAKLDKATGQRDGGRNVWITLTLGEGKNREVRRVLEAIGLTVNRLIRLSYGPFSLGTLAPGEVEEVGPRVIREQLAPYIDVSNLPKGAGVQFRGSATGPARRAAAAATAEGVEAPTARAPRPFKPRPGQDTGELKSPERPVKKPGWAKAKPKPPGGLRTPKKPGAKPYRGDNPSPPRPAKPRTPRPGGGKGR